ncbi:MAG: oligosaccharide flippase family protein [Flavobacteriales bacterium]|nr:oligosaccharide flippase family protein [Flavobacteriales bacterium]
MQRTFLTNLSLLLLLNLMIKPAYLLFVETEVQNRVGAEVFGNYAALLNLSFLLNIFLDLGINTFTSRSVARKQHMVASYFNSVALLRLSLVALYFVLLIGAALILQYEGADLKLLAWLGLNQLLSASILYLRSNLSGMMLFSRDAVVSVLDRAILLLGLGAVLFASPAEEGFNIYLLVYGQTIAYAVGMVVALVMVIQKAGKIQLRWKPRVNRVILKESLPYALLVLLMMVYYKTDSVMLERMLPDGDYHSGVYAMGYRLFEASNMVGFLFATLLLPLLSKQLKHKEDTTPLVSNAFRLILVGGSIMSFTCALWPSEILSLVYDAEIEAASSPFMLLMISFFFMMMTYLWGTLLTANGDMKAMNRIAGSAVILNIVLNCILIPEHTSTGSALASLATQILVAIVQIILCYRLVKIKLQNGVFLRSLLFLSILATSAWVTTIIDLAWELEFAGFLGVAVVSSFLTGLLRLVYVRSLLADRM